MVQLNLPWFDGWLAIELDGAPARIELRVAEGRFVGLEGAPGEVSDAIR